MTHKSAETYVEFLDLLTLLTKQTEVARRMGIAVSTIRTWLGKSKDAERAEATGSEYYFEYEGQARWFHKHAKLTVRRSVEDIEAHHRHRALHGTWKVARDKGAVVYKRDPRLVGNPDLQELVGQTDDLLRINGEAQPEMIHEEPPVELVAMYLSAYTNIFRKGTNSMLDINVGGGVMVLGKTEQKKIKPPPIDIEVIEYKPEPEPIDEIKAAPGPQPQPRGPHPEVNRARTPMRIELERQAAERLAAASTV